MKRVAISGYFNPLHVGHLDYIREAKLLGEWLIVIVNNDKQVKLKGSKPFMNEKERIEIVSQIKGVDEVVLSTDEDSTVCKTLSYLKPDIFANGGDRKEDNVPESGICKAMRIKEVYNIGGKKVQSSSKLLREIK